MPHISTPAPVMPGAKCRFEGGCVNSPGYSSRHVDGVGRGAAVFIVINAACGLRGSGDVAAHEHVDDIDPVREEIGDLASAEIEISAPVPDTAGDRNRAILQVPGNAPNRDLKVCV